MSLPYSVIVPISASVQKPAFGTEKKHMILAMVNPLIPSGINALEFDGETAFASYFGRDIPEYAQVCKYFGRLSKTGLAPDKIVVARWFKEDTAPFYKGKRITASVAELKAMGEGSVTLNMGGIQYKASLNLSSVTSYSDVASALQTAIRSNVEGGEMYAKSTVVFNSVTGGLIVTAGTSGKDALIDAVEQADTGFDYAAPLGLVEAELSQGVDAEKFSDFCDRIYHANVAGFSITTMETLTRDDITAAVNWLQTVQNGQTYNTRVRLVFNVNDLSEAKAIQSELSDMTGYVMCYDPYGEFINVLDCSICASIDHNVVNGSINFNFQPAAGYTPVTDLGTVTDYQSGQTNVILWDDLNAHKISCVYSVGFGSAETTYYGKGLMQGAFGTEDVQVNESWLEEDIQVRVMNAFNTLNKVKLQGQDAVELVSTLIAPSFEKGKQNGSIARNGTLTDSDRLGIVQATGVAAAPDAVANNGYYFKVQELTAEDIAERRVRIVSCYLCGGVVNEIRIINNIYGA